MATIRQKAFPRIVHDPEIVGGEATVRGTRVPVRSIVLMYRLYHDIDRLRRAFPRLDSGAIADALAYYEANRDEIERYIAENGEDEAI